VVSQVTVAAGVDNTPPTLTCPADIIVTNDPGACGATVIYAGTATDICDPNPTINTLSGPASGALFPLGLTTVTLQAVDAAGNPSTPCSFNVNVGTTSPTPADFIVNNDASFVGANCYQITEALNSESGSIWYQKKLTLDIDFCLEFTINLGTKDVNGADGLAFVLQPINTGQGSAGLGIGYAGITPSVAVEFDTYQNASDPADDHVAIQKMEMLSMARIPWQALLLWQTWRTEISIRSE
jgi:hypothetical protein